MLCLRFGTQRRLPRRRQVCARRDALSSWYEVRRPVPRHPGPSTRARDRRRRSEAPPAPAAPSCRRHWRGAPTPSTPSADRAVDGVLWEAVTPPSARRSSRRSLIELHCVPRQVEATRPRPPPPPPPPLRGRLALTRPLPRQLSSSVGLRRPSARDHLAVLRVLQARRSPPPGSVLLYIPRWRASPRRGLLPSARTSSCVVAFVVAELRAPSRSWTRCRCHAPRLPAPLAHAASSAPRPSAWRSPRPRRPAPAARARPRQRLGLGRSRAFCELGVASAARASGPGDRHLYACAAI